MDPIKELIELITPTEGIRLVDLGDHGGPNFVIQQVAPEGRKTISFEYLKYEWGMDILSAPLRFRDHKVRGYDAILHTMNSVTKVLDIEPMSYAGPLWADKEIAEAYEERLTQLAYGLGLSKNLRGGFSRLASHMACFFDFRDQGLYPEYSVLRADATNRNCGFPVPMRYKDAAERFLFRAVNPTNEDPLTDFANALKLYQVAFQVSSKKQSSFPTTQEFYDRIAKEYERDAFEADCVFALLQYVEPIFL